MSIFFKFSGIISLLIIAFLIGCANKQNITISEIIDNSMLRKKPALIFYYQSNTKQYKKMQDIFMSQEIKNILKDSFLFYKIDINEVSYFQELLYSYSKNYFLVLNGDSISSIFISPTNPKILKQRLNNSLQYTFASQIDKFSLLRYDSKMIGNVINSILRLQYLKIKKEISSREFYIKVKETTTKISYFYNNYLLADLSLDINEQANTSFLDQMTTMKHKVYDSLLRKYLLKVNNITMKDFAKVHFECLKHNFEKVKMNDTVRYCFKYKNIGKIPYIIYNVETSCHCTVSEWTKKPVLVNAQDSICVLFSQTSPGAFRKAISIKSNINKELYLEISGEVIP